MFDADVVASGNAREYMDTNGNMFNFITNIVSW